MAASHFGLTQSEVEDTVSTALNDAVLGWEQISGIQFRKVDNANRDVTTVTYQVVETILPGDPDYTYAWGVCIPAGTYDWNPTNTWVQIEATHFADLGITNHEAAHAFFHATHSPEGSDSLMEPYEDPGSEAPSATDLAQVEQWLSTYDPPDPPKPIDEGGNVYWFPADLSTYITRWPVPEGSEARLTAPVLEGARVALQALYHTDYAELLAGNGSRFTRGIDCYHEGFHRSPWRPCPSGEVYVGVTVQMDNEADVLPLIVGQAEVQIRGT